MRNCAAGSLGHKGGPCDPRVFLTVFANSALSQVGCARILAERLNCKGTFVHCIRRSTMRIATFGRSFVWLAWHSSRSGRSRRGIVVTKRYRTLAVRELALGIWSSDADLWHLQGLILRDRVAFTFATGRIV
jgi:hypothetical protein